MSSQETAQAVKRTLRTVAAAVALMYVVVAALAVFTFLQASQAHTALCTLRGDIETRVESGEEFLRKHPHGIPGIPAPVIRNSLVGQHHTLDALDNLSC